MLFLPLGCFSRGDEAEDFPRLRARNDHEKRSGPDRPSDSDESVLRFAALGTETLDRVPFGSCRLRFLEPIVVLVMTAPILLVIPFTTYEKASGIV